MSDTVSRAVANLLHDERLRIPLAVLKGFRNGLVYGVKVRLPHAIIMTFLFHNGSLQEKLSIILSLTYQHARNLALLATIYKTSTMLIKKKMGRSSPIITFLSAAVAGYIMFGSNNKLNMQVNLYLLSRVILALVKLAVKRNILPSMNIFPWFAALMWGASLVLFEYEQETLHPSLSASMTYIFHDSEHWTNLWDLFMYNTLSLQ